jgi:hypothetical protein
MSEAPLELHTMERLGPWGVAREMEKLIPDTLAKRDAAKDKRERKRFSGQLRVQRMLLKWCKSRAGYVDPGPNKT